MNLQDTLKQIVKDQGKDVLQKPELPALLEDYHAYDAESPAIRAIIRHLVRSGTLKALLTSRKSGTGLQSEVRDIVTRTSALGFKEEAVSDVLKAVVFASGKMSRESEWPKVLNPQKTPVQVVQRAEPSKPSVWKRLRKWLWTYSEDFFVVALLITTILTVVTLFLTFVAFVNGTPQVGHWAKEFLICLISTVVLFFTYVFTDR